MILDQTFKGQDYSQIRLPKGEYEHCIFEGCIFLNGYLDNQHFMECQFIDCNLGNVNIAHTVFNDVNFERCKMIGMKFENCNDFLMDFSFVHCDLSFASFYGLSLKAKTFNHCKLIEADFTTTNLSKSIFAHCDLTKAIFSQTNLQNTDFTSALNFTIDPEKNQLKGARFSKDGLPGLLTKHQLKIEG